MLIFGNVTRNAFPPKTTYMVPVAPQKKEGESLPFFVVPGHPLYQGLCHLCGNHFTRGLCPLRPLRRRAPAAKPRGFFVLPPLWQPFFTWAMPQTPPLRACYARMLTLLALRYRLMAITITNTSKSRAPNPSFVRPYIKASQSGVLCCA